MSNAGAVRAGAAFVELFADGKGLDKGLKDAEKRLKNWGSNISAVGRQVFALGGAITAPFVAAAGVFQTVGSDLFKMSARTGASVEQLSALSFAADQAGVSAEGLEHGLRHAQKSISEAAGGSLEAQQAFRLLGVSFADLSRQSAGDQMATLADALSKVSNPTQRAAEAMKIFGRGGTELLPLLSLGSAGIGQLTAKAQELGLVMSHETAASANEFRKATSALWAQLKMVSVEVGAFVAPSLQLLISRVSPVVRWFTDFARANREVFTTALAVGGGLLAAGAGLTLLGSVVSKVGAGIGVLAKGVSLAGSVIGFMVSPVGLVTGALALGGYAFFRYTQAGQAAFADLKATALDSWQGISDALQAGDLGAALDVVLAGMGLAWQQTWGKMSRYFTDPWSDLKLVFIDFASDFILSSGFMTKALLTYGSTVDKILNKVGALSDADLAKRLETAEAGKELAGSDAGLKALRDAVKANALKNHGDEHQANADDFAGDLADAQARLDAAVAAARAAREKSRRPGELPGAPGVGDFQGSIKADTAGTFAGLAAGRLGGGTTDSAQTVLNTAMAVEKLNRLIQIAEQGGFAVA